MGISPEVQNINAESGWEMWLEGKQESHVSAPAVKTQLQHTQMRCW